MQYRSGKELRELYLNFFQEKGCKRCHSFSLVPDDPTLLFTIAGMVPFKPYFLGLKTPEFTRATTSQKCVRTNDIENVGRTARHHTFFEMLGNFSFGDYFKKDVIPWAWEFLTERVGLEPERLYITVFRDDDEAYDIWHKIVGVPKDHLFRLDEDENFWASGPVGPCGPCSEIIYDQGEKFSCGRPDCDINCDCDRYLEIWNLVFMQYNRDEEGNLTPLPKKNIDTGMGLERITSVVQRVPNDFETDLFLPIIEATCQLVKVKYGENPQHDMAVKIIADHVRASAFMIADGVLPANDGGGYVLRRIIRRSARYGKLLGINEPFLTKLLPVVRESIGDEYSELAEQEELIAKVISIEEERFHRTLTQGSELLDGEIAKLKESNEDTLSGNVAFILYDTFGFPFELTQEICFEAKIKVDEKRFYEEMEAQRARARASSKQTSSIISKTVYNKIADEVPATKFCGYDESEMDTEVLAIIVDGVERDTLNEGEKGELILRETPFYGEKGGQVGDKGIITALNARFEVDDAVYPDNEIIAHKGTLIAGTLSKGDSVHALIDVKRRTAIGRHHTATHLLHEALVRVLGPHVRQAGSLVTPTFLRFDFNHYAPVTVEELQKVEMMVYEEVLKNTNVNTSIMSVREAKEMGAKALFDEKYGNEVRVLDIDGFSTELCGGTHVGRTGDVGLIKIIREEGVGSGLRRINAVAGVPALKFFDKTVNACGCMINMLGGDVETLTAKVEEILDEKKVLERKNKELTVASAIADIENTLEPVANVNGVDLIVESFEDITPALLRQVGDRIRQKYSDSIILLAGKVNNKKVALIAMSSESAINKGAHAGKMLKQVASLMKGKGGGNPSLAQGGSSEVALLDDALKRAPEIFASIMRSN